MRANDQFGLDVLAPGTEFEELQATVERATSEETKIYRTEDGGVRFSVVAVEAPDTRQAVVIPAFLPLSDEPPLRQRAADEGVSYTHVRPLSGDVRVSFAHDDPAPFF